jgi:hypothetical protein
MLALNVPRATLNQKLKANRIRFWVAQRFTAAITDFKSTAATP